MIMITMFVIGIAILIGGYLTYSKYVERVLEIDENRPTPAIEHRDDVDFMPLNDRKNKLIQLLNIAGTGPIYGPIAGAVFGPIALIIIPIGNILMGSVHDFMSGFISMRNKGASLPLLARKYLGEWSKYAVLIFSILLLMLVGTVFVTSPAELMVANFSVNKTLIIAIIFIYYIISTITPIDKVIGRIYPFITGILLVGTGMVFLSVLFMSLTGKVEIPAVTMNNVFNWNPSGAAIVPGFFVMVSCGLISGFHATQSPIVAKTIESESKARSTFYGMMVAEGVIAMIWCFITIVLFSPEHIASTPQPAIVAEVAKMALGSYLSWVLVIAVIVLPITSGDTAFRSLRMIIAEAFSISQTTIVKRVLLAIPIFFCSYLLLTVIDFSTLWLYFTWSNHMLAVIMLLTATAYLMGENKNYLITLIPGIILFIIDMIYLLQDQKIGFGMQNHVVAQLSAAVFALVVTFVVIRKSVGFKAKKNQ